MATGTTEPSSPDEDLNQDLEGLLFSFHAAKEKYFPENIWPDVSLAKVDLDVITTEVSRLFLETLLKVLDKCVGPAAVECFLDTGNMKRFEFVRKEGPENNDVLRKPLAILRKWDTIIVRIPVTPRLSATTVYQTGLRRRAKTVPLTLCVPSSASSTSPPSSLTGTLISHITCTHHLHPRPCPRPLPYLPSRWFFLSLSSKPAFGPRIPSHYSATLRIVAIRPSRR